MSGACGHQQDAILTWIRHQMMHRVTKEERLGDRPSPSRSITSHHEAAFARPNQQRNWPGGGLRNGTVACLSCPASGVHASVYGSAGSNVLSTVQGGLTSDRS